uniref:Uncharacterized protein n=1 Tax=Chenopodium quinoa TaxID=63459 RepID=A0A803M1R6_CHEQI
MESPSRTLTLSQPNHSLRRRRSSSDSVNSPEFEFSNTGCDPQSATLLSADELFSDGFLLPLHRLHPHQSVVPEPDTGPTDPDPCSRNE